jgi:uncharacterized damage-inducible protein DinB
MSSRPEAWLGGPLPGIPVALQPVGHALVQAVEEADQAVSDLSREALWTSPGGAASVGYHVRHMAGALDRLFTYARGEALTDAQRAALRDESASTPEMGGSQLIAALRAAVDRALAQLRETNPDRLDDPRTVGRARLPSSVRGLLHHAGEHTVRHAGQAITTAKIVAAGREP